jgi:uncharacterized protein YlxW (UPF0749 family)
MARRLAWLTKRPTMWSVAVPLVALVAGMLFSASSHAARGTDLRSTATGMPDLIRERTLNNERLGANVADLQAQVDELNRQAAPGNTRIEELTRKGDQLGLAAGTRPLEGPSVTVVLDDSSLAEDQLPADTPGDFLVVHQQDVQAVVNALWRGGAEAMTLMDQRVISTSAVRCVGNTLILQGRVYSPPYTVTALGDRASLLAALEADRTVAIYREYVAQYGLGYEVSTSPSRVFPAYAGSTQLRYAEPSDS